MLRTTWYDGDALSVREALHFGLPVIATDNGMRPEGVRLIPPRDENALLAAIHGTLAMARPKSQASSASGNENLMSVLDMYRQLKG
jgi:glycosyltransferase involved in cell wall biosynthesis